MSTRLRSKLLALCIMAILGSLLLAFATGKKDTDSNPDNQTQKEVQMETPQILSVNPDLKNSPILIPSQVIEITFNLPIENKGEFKNRIDDFKDYEIKLSDDRKVVKIIPSKPFELGKSYTLFILKDTKFDGGKRMNNDEHFNFRTIDYHGV